MASEIDHCRRSRRQSSLCSATNHFTLHPFRREAEEETIRQAFLASRNSIQVVLVSGASGVGKSLLVRVALQAHIQDCWVGRAKSEFQRSPLPLAPLRQLMADICKEILDAPVAILQECRDESQEWIKRK